MSASAKPPTYSLARIKELVAAGQRVITGTAQCDAGVLGFAEADIEECIQSLQDADFHKTMPAESVKGLFQDVYYPRFRGRRLYVKLQIAASVMNREQAVVISFKLP